jgi:hypothetical protein
MTDGRPARATRAVQLALDAIAWQASDDPHPPASIRGLSTADQAALARAAHRAVAAADALAARSVERGAEQE